MVIIDFVLLCYCLLVIVLWAGWNRAIRRNSTKDHLFAPLVSVIIPVRNEEEHIQSLLDDLIRQHYKNFEVIVVDDHSEDKSLEIISHHLRNNFQVILNRGQGKKSAITTGIAHANGSVIVTTDADCGVLPAWLNTIVGFFGDPKVMMAFGPVCIHGEAFFSDIQSIEFASLIGSGAATAALGKPTMCNGANLAYRKHIFYEVDGYQGNETIASGDDEFLMRKIHRAYPDGIRFIGEANAIVSTRPQHSLKSFFQQRVRWAGKWKNNSSWFTISLAVFIVMGQAAFMISIGKIFISFTNTSLFLVITKSFLELCFLFSVSRFLKIRWSWISFFILQLLYPFYVIIIGMAANFFSVFWKGRKINH